MSGGYPKRFAEYNSTTATGTAVDLSGRKQVYDAYDAKDGNNYTNRRNETAESPVLTAEEAAFYTSKPLWAVMITGIQLLPQSRLQLQLM